MKPILMIAVLVLTVAPSAVFSQLEETKGSPPRAGETSSEQEVRQLEQQLRNASLKGDASFFDRVWDEEYSRTNSIGAVLDRKEALEDYNSGDLKYDRLDFDDVRIRVFGDTAIVTARATIKGRYEDTKLEGAYRHTRVWVKRPGGWKVVAYHTSRLEAVAY